MKICLCLTGMMYGVGGRNVSMKDIRHCWPNIKKNLVDTLVNNGHQVDVLLSTYKVDDVEIEKSILNTIGPKHTFYSNINNSSPLTCKVEPLEYMYSLDYDFFIMSRSDIHYNKDIITSAIKFDKFNFLFPEQNYWKNNRYCTDNLYMWPREFTPYFKQSILDAKRKHGGTHTHDIYNELCLLLGEQYLNIMSKEEELSDVNSFYSLCRPKLGPERLHMLNAEVRERFYK